MSYSTITIELYNHGMMVYCGDISEELFIAKGDAYDLIEFINDVEEMCNTCPI